MRLYLGEIKTPFNKQRLIERLAAFLLNANNQRIIMESFDELDMLILTAVHTLPTATRTALSLFLASEPALQTRLANLEQRLVLYCSGSFDEKEQASKAYHINPFLYKAVASELDPRVLFFPLCTAEVKSGMLVCDDIVLAGLYSFFLKEVDVFKVDGSFKVKAEKQLKTIFEDSAETLSSIKTLCSGLENLGLLIPSKSGYIPQQARWEEFFEQQPFNRRMYSAAAVYGSARRDILQRRAQFLSDFLRSLDPCGLYDDVVLRRIFYISYQRLLGEPDAHKQVFPSMFEEVQSTSMDMLKMFAFLLPVGDYWQVNQAVFSQESTEQPLIIASSFELIMLPFTSLKHKFPVLNCLEPASILTAGRFTITRSACLRCFEQGYTDTDIITLLETATSSSIPQNIPVSISEWYCHGTAISLYSGLVITVAEDKRQLFLRNEELKKIICKELASGVYLLKCVSEDSVRAVLKSAGLEALFYSGRSVAPYTPIGFSSIEMRNIGYSGPEEKTQEGQPTQYKARFDYKGHINALQELVDTMAIDDYNKRSLKEKILNKLIITKEQLHGLPMDSEVQEVSGRDFLGKIHLAETAIAEKSRIEVSIDSTRGRHVIIGTPLSIEKTEGDAQLLIQDVRTQYKQKVSIAGIVKMKVFRSSFL